MPEIAAAMAAMNKEQQGAFIAAMAVRLHTKTGLPIEIIIAIISQLLPLIMSGCNKPANVTDARALLAHAAANHPDSCPIWYRSAFRQNGVRDRDDINDLWAGFVVDSNAHATEAARALMAAA